MNKGETVEDVENKNLGYKNIVIKNIIEDIRELLDEDFFKFDIDENDDKMISNNNTNDLNIIGFDEV